MDKEITVLKLIEFIKKNSIALSNTNLPRQILKFYELLPISSKIIGNR